MKFVSHSRVVAVLFTLGMAHGAAADPIVITGGSMLVTGPFESGSISLTGTRGFSLRANVDPAEGEVSAINRCGAVGDPICVGGSTISIRTAQVGSGFPNGVATLDGVTYDDISSIFSPATVLLRLQGTVTLPEFQDSPVTLTARFTVGESLFFLPSPTAPVEIQGSGGTATLRLVPGFEQEEPGIPTPWIVDLIRYDFNDAAAIPEPSTVLLVAVGLAGAWRRHRRAPKKDTLP
jgi:PEP-CTERM motif